MSFRILISYFLLLVALPSYAQVPKYFINEIGGEVYDRNNFTFANTAEGRFGVYYFGMSEGELQLVIIKNGVNAIVQIWTGEWVNDTETGDLMRKESCKTFNNAILKKNKILFGRYCGTFADYTGSGKIEKALLLDGDVAYSGRRYKGDTVDVGTYSSIESIPQKDAGDYQLSLAIKTASYFRGKSKQELKIMRNAIYAKYGFIFQKDGEMDAYFRKKTWYQPFHKEVSDCLTTIEKKNIQTLARLEQL